MDKLELQRLIAGKKVVLYLFKYYVKAIDDCKKPCLGEFVNMLKGVRKLFCVQNFLDDTCVKFGFNDMTNAVTIEVKGVTATFWVITYDGDEVDADLTAMYLSTEIKRLNDEYDILTRALKTYDKQKRKADWVKNVMRLGKVVGKVANVSFVYNYRPTEVVFRFIVGTENPNRTHDFQVAVDYDLGWGSLCKRLREYANNYDVDTQTYKELDSNGHGRNGAPYCIRDILIEKECIKDELTELANAVCKGVSVKELLDA